MIRRRKPDPADDQEWADIVSRGQQLSEEHVRSYRAKSKYEIDEKLYKKYMSYLLALFDEKCAYCETQLTSNQPGDVEHFRPKGRVVGEDFKPIKISFEGHDVEHPGYFWLAYDWTNLLPSCIDCNRYRIHGKPTPVGAAGKADRFPVRGGSYACGLDRLADEQPLLINPRLQSPAKHLQFNADGTVTPLTEEGETTIRILGLNLRPGLRKARLEAFKAARDLAEAYWTAVSTRNAAQVEERRPDLEAIKNGSAYYAAVQRLAVAQVNARIEEEQRLLRAMAANDREDDDG